MKEQLKKLMQPMLEKYQARMKKVDAAAKGGNLTKAIALATPVIAGLTGVMGGALGGVIGFAAGVQQAASVATTMMAGGLGIAVGATSLLASTYIVCHAPHIGKKLYQKAQELNAPKTYQAEENVTYQNTQTNVSKTSKMMRSIQSTFKKFGAKGNVTKVVTTPKQAKDNSFKM